jgi:AraC-like DNA-binding protein
MQKIYFKYITTDEEYGKKDPLFLNSFGYWEKIAKNSSVLRPTGRKDYQLLYVSSGTIIANNQKLKNGEFYIMVPDELQDYTYVAVENSKYYWIHFTGNKIEEILKYYNISHGFNEKNSFSNEIETLLNSLFYMISLDDEESNKSRTAIFQSILPLLGAPNNKIMHYSRAEKLLSDPNSDVTIVDLANMYNITPEHFIRTFKNAYGKTPSNYRTYSRITLAKNLLTESTFTISEIANMCSFTDSYYFSKLFKKYVGMSPLKYRNRFLNNH